jgi:geranyl-CoA carboxylase alpha subunit
MRSATPFRKLLVANRGEIALRVFRTAARMGLATVAVHSTADAGAPHVLAADEAVCIGEAAPAASYLDIAALVAAARATGADAVHPGYGFLAENADFAQACRDAGLVFVGPSPEAIRAMGDKAGAKALLQQAGVPCIPGYQGEDQGEARLAAEAERIGWPLMVKATAGGGGRGMRLVRDAASFRELLRSAQSEARHAFGDGTVLLERAIERPRHVEIQVFADRHGNVVHLGERDCSIQRRHQKLVEEAPSPAVDAALRARMGAAAVAAARAIAYEGAGTLEFLLEADGRFHFMEMNTRLQVEHPVTEALTGLDLVEWQLRVAAGEPLPLAQDAIRFEGHAIEVRLCAEDADHGFVPQGGTVLRWQPPAPLRVEHALADGAAVPPWYDSMVAKLVAHGRDREDARRQLAQGLRRLVALGVTTNQAFLARCLEHPVFASGGATTAFVAEYGAELLSADAREAGRAAAVAAWLLHGRAGPGTAAALVPQLARSLRFTLDGRDVATTLQPGAGGACAVAVGGTTHHVVSDGRGGPDPWITLDGASQRVCVAVDGRTTWFQLDGRPHQLQDRTLEPLRRAGAAGSDGRITASMNGRVVAVLAEPGQPVRRGQAVCTLEAMKMEHMHAAPCDGTLAAVHVAPGAQVQAAQLLAEVRPEAAAPQGAA